MRCKLVALQLGACVLGFLGLASPMTTAESAPLSKENNLKTEAPNWPQWRGPSGQGYSSDTRVPLTWDEKKNVLWKTELPGQGNSSPIVWGDRIFLTAAKENGKQRVVLCINANGGDILWERLAAKDPSPDKSHGWNGYASPSCTTDGKYVYAFFGNAGLFCYDFAGDLVWKHPFGIFTSQTGWGIAASPFLYEDMVIQNCDNDGPDFLPPGHKPDEAAPAVLIALDKVTGKERWRTSRDQGRGFSTPRIVSSPQGAPELILNGPRGVWSYEPKTGKEIWHCERQGSGDSHKFGEPIPVCNKDTLFAPSGRPGPFQAIKLGGKGDVTKTHLLWQVERKGHRDVASQILWDDYLYAADSKGFLTCHDTKTGNVMYNERLSSKFKALASPVAVRDHLLFVLDDGETVVVRPGDTLQVAGRNKLGTGAQLDFAASPAVVDGKMYLRSQSYLYCIGEKK